MGFKAATDSPLRYEKKSGWNPVNLSRCWDSSYRNDAWV